MFPKNVLIFTRKISQTKIVNDFIKFVGSLVLLKSSIIHSVSWQGNGLLKLVELGLLG